jgi:5'-deoxynucleotidase YfbR-like HD superfamily hydrolase
MKHLTKLFHLLELTRNQPQYGYAIWGGNVRMGNLAEHHYMVSMIAWQLASVLNESGAKLNIQKVLEFALIHDVGELFGGDISMPYAKANPEARKYAKSFEAENQKYIAKFFGDQSKHFIDLSSEILDADSDESRLVKVADYLEVTHYKFFIGKFINADIDLVADKLMGMIQGMKDVVAKNKLIEFIISWKDEMGKLDSYPDLIHKIIS